MEIEIGYLWKPLQILQFFVYIQCMKSVCCYGCVSFQNIHVFKYLVYYSMVYLRNFTLQKAYIC